MIGLVYALTMVFNLYIPQTQGFFNFGEVGVYISALIGGPIVGFIAGSIGSSLADITLGYSYYAPGTFIIKGVEGFIVGFMAILIDTELRGKKTLFIGISSIVPLALIMYLFGVNLYIGEAEVSLPMGVYYSIALNEAVWMVSSTIFAIVVIYLTLKYSDVSGWVVAMAMGGLEMVLGYYLYEQYILGYMAIAEVPFNLMQVIIGIFGATIVTHYLRRVRI